MNDMFKQGEIAKRLEPRDWHIPLHPAIVRAEPKEPEIDIFPKATALDRILPYAVSIAFGIMMFSWLAIKILEIPKQ